MGSYTYTFSQFFGGTDINSSGSASHHIIAIFLNSYIYFSDLRKSFFSPVLKVTHTADFGRGLKG